MIHFQKKFLISWFFFFSFFPLFSVKAGTPLEDIELKLSVETQDLAYDFQDHDEVIEKGRQVIYKLEIINHGQQGLSQLSVFMEPPSYMEYEPSSTFLQEEWSEQWVSIEDKDGLSSLTVGQELETIGAGETMTIHSKYKVTVPDSVLDEPLLTLANATLLGPYSDLPVVSNFILNKISGSPQGSLSIHMTSMPEAGKTVFLGSEIIYHYQLYNAGDIPVKNIVLKTFLPEGTSCLENCGVIHFKKDLGPEELFSLPMAIKVNKPGIDQSEIKNIGYDASSSSLPYTEIRQDTIHPLNKDLNVGTNEFTLQTEQVPEFVLNSPDKKPRSDQADWTEAQYVIRYSGRGRPNTFQLSKGYGIQDTGFKTHHGFCSDYIYPHGKNSGVYAYNSSGGSCENMSQCPLKSTPLDFLIQTHSPQGRPTLLFSNNTNFQSKHFIYGDTASVNTFMKSGGVVKPPEKFTLTRATENGEMGEYHSSVKSQKLTEDFWIYSYAGYSKVYDSCSCGEDCVHTDKYPVYTWKKKQSTPIQLEATDKSHASVYTATAWLKTQAGHVGTNGQILNHETEANRLHLPFPNLPYITSNEYVHDPEKILTPSRIYTPFDEKNSDFMIFSKHNDSFASISGKEWSMEGTDFNFLNQGEVYNRENNPRNYKDDLLVKQKFGLVKVDQLPQKIQGKLDIGNQIVWHQKGDLFLGQKNMNDKLVLTGGQSRLYVEGDVYIEADIFYEGEIPLLRIDARNIYISGEVKTIEALLLARENFYSGESHEPLSILGDVITKNAHWQRKPVLKNEPEEINQPSEHLIEDLRKYVFPVPGDAQLPDEYDEWQQVNSGDGLIYSGY